MWQNEWEQLSEKDREQFMKVLNRLFQCTFIVREEIDQKSKTVVINKDFRFIERYYTLFKNYLKVSGWELQLDNYLGVIALYNRYGYSRHRLNKHVTYFLYILRLIYEEQREKLSMRKEALTTIGEMVEKMFHLGLIEKKPADTVLRESLSVLRNFNIIERIEGSWTSPETRLVIYPSILLLVTNEKIAALYQWLKQDGSGDEAGEEEADEDLTEDALD